MRSVIRRRLIGVSNVSGWGDKAETQRLLMEAIDRYAAKTSDEKSPATA